MTLSSSVPQASLAVAPLNNGSSCVRQCIAKIGFRSYGFLYPGFSAVTNIVNRLFNTHTSMNNIWTPLRAFRSLYIIKLALAYPVKTTTNFILLCIIYVRDTCIYHEHSAENFIALLKQGFRFPSNITVKNEEVVHLAFQTELAEQLKLPLSNRGESLAVFLTTWDPWIQYRRRNASSDTQTKDLSIDALKMIKKAIKEAGRNQGKHIIALIGNTGTGKSTAINDFIGRTLVREGGMVRVRPGETEVAQIGHGSRSCTSLTRVYREYPIPGTTLPLVLADCGGFLDTRGIVSEIVATTSLKLTLENAASVRLVLCYDSTVLPTDRSSFFATFLQTTLRQLVTDYQDARCRSAIMLMFTKPRLYEDERAASPVRYTAESLLKELRRLRDDIDPNNDLRRLLDYVLREDGKFVCLYDPVCQGEPSNASKTNILTTLVLMAGITQPGNFFKIVYPPEASAKLLELITSLLYRRESFYDRFTRNDVKTERLQEIKTVASIMP